LYAKATPFHWFKPWAMTLIANGFKVSDWKLLRLALDLLHGKNINVCSLKEGNDPRSSGSDAVYVPGCYLHS
jgi:hypothetical protein